MSPARRRSRSRRVRSEQPRVRVSAASPAPWRRPRMTEDDPRPAFDDSLAEREETRERGRGRDPAASCGSPTAAGCQSHLDRLARSQRRSERISSRPVVGFSVLNALKKSTTDDVSSARRRSQVVCLGDMQGCAAMYVDSARRCVTARKRGRPLGGISAPSYCWGAMNWDCSPTHSLSQHHAGDETSIRRLRRPGAIPEKRSARPAQTTTTSM